MPGVKSCLILRDRSLFARPRRIPKPSLRDRSAPFLESSISRQLFLGNRSLTFHFGCSIQRIERGRKRQIISWHRWIRSLLSALFAEKNAASDEQKSNQTGQTNLPLQGFLHGMAAIIADGSGRGATLAGWWSRKQQSWLTSKVRQLRIAHASRQHHHEHPQWSSQSARGPG